MTRPEIRMVPNQTFIDLCAAARECAEDLEAELQERYPEHTRSKYPSEARRFERDMEPVRKVRTALSQALSDSKPTA